MFTSLTQEQSALADTVYRFAEKELADGALKRAHSREYPGTWQQSFAKWAFSGLR